MLASLDDRIELLDRAGAQRVVVLAFTRELSRWSAERFAGDLVERLGMRRLIVGPGFALGRGREGDVDFLSRLGSARGFSGHERRRVEPGWIGGLVGADP